jgi:NAD(P)-dependent dehydrogenase (short-subunit alcohol dehydrogenase family)
VIGANKGIGLEVARRLATLGWTVWLGCRDEARGAAAAAALEDLPGIVRAVQLDVTDADSVAMAVKAIGAAGGLDVLVNNAGISGRWQEPEDTEPADFLPVFGVNLLGPVRMVHACLPLLRESPQPRIVNVSSGMGSFAVTTDSERFESTLHGLVYPASKAALNMVTSQYAKALPLIQVVAVDPGYTQTDFNGRRGTQTVQQGAAPVVAAATMDPTAPSGQFLGANGPLGW